MPEPMLSSPAELLTKLVSINSVFPNEGQLSDYIAQLLRNLGLEVTEVPSTPARKNLIARFGRSERYLGFYGHMDTVPPAADYVRDPFSISVEGDIARGLGVVDMKGGLVCILHAAQYAVQNNFPIVVIFGVDEENISRGAHDLVDSGELADVGFLIVAESGQVQDYNQPLSVCLGRKGRLVYGITVSGKAAHAADAHKGVNAIERAAELICAFRQLRFPPHPSLGQTSVVIQGIHASTGSFSIPDHCDLQISLLTTPGVTGALFEREIQQLAHQLGISIQVSPAPRETPYAESYELDAGDAFYEILKEHVLAPIGAVPFYTSSVADENIFANRLGIPVLTMGPIGDGDHTKDEWVKLSSIASVIEAYKNAIRLYSTRS